MGAPLHPYTCECGANFWKYDGLGSAQTPIMVPCLEPVNQPTLYLRSILNVYEVFEPLHMLSMCIWVHPYTVTPVQVGEKFEIIWAAKGEPI